MQFRPHNYQSYCIDRLLELPAVGLFLDMGLGKTVKVGELKYEGLELLNAKDAVVCAVKLTRAARGAAATAGK